MTNIEVGAGVGQLQEVQRGIKGPRRVENRIHSRVQGQDPDREQGQDHNRGTSVTKRLIGNLEEVATQDLLLHHLEGRGNILAVL